MLFLYKTIFFSENFKYFEKKNLQIWSIKFSRDIVRALRNGRYLVEIEVFRYISKTLFQQRVLEKRYILNIKYLIYLLFVFEWEMSWYLSKYLLGQDSARKFDRLNWAKVTVVIMKIDIYHEKLSTGTPSFHVVIAFCG